jgi:NADH:ubiquinone oxidoreductase subunit K
MISYGLAFYLIGMIAFIFHQGNNILMMIISLELILLSVGIILVNAETPIALGSPRNRNWNLNWLKDS